MTADGGALHWTELTPLMSWFLRSANQETSVHPTGLVDHALHGTEPWKRATPFPSRGRHTSATSAIHESSLSTLWVSPVESATGSIAAAYPTLKYSPRPLPSSRKWRESKRTGRKQLTDSVDWEPEIKAKCTWWKRSNQLDKPSKKWNWNETIMRRGKWEGIFLDKTQPTAQKLKKYNNLVTAEAYKNESWCKTATQRETHSN